MLEVGIGRLHSTPISPHVSYCRDFINFFNNFKAHKKVETYRLIKLSGQNSGLFDRLYFLFFVRVENQIVNINII